MRPHMLHAWSCDDEHFEDDAALARHLAARIDAGQNGISFAREGCWFRVDYEDGAPPATMTPPVDAFLRSRTYSVTLITNSPNCTGGNVFTATWPGGFIHEPALVVAQDAPPDAPVIVDGTANDVRRVLTGMGSVLWPDLYDIERAEAPQTPEAPTGP
jgi:hypothetical protein